MNLKEWIAINDICTHYRVEKTFVETLAEHGMLEIKVIKEQHVIHCDTLPHFEKLRRLHYDLHINVEGLEAVQTLLAQVQKLQQENQALKNRLHLYE